LLLDEDGEDAPPLELDGLLAPELDGALLEGELALLEPLEPDGLFALELEGELALGLDELAPPELAPLEEPVALDEPVDAEPDDSLTPSAASVFWSSLPEAWIPLDCWNSLTAAWVFGPSLPSAGPLSMPAALSFC
jgi:hypothetical protein